jgi:hypothetical protein
MCKVLIQSRSSGSSSVSLLDRLSESWFDRISGQRSHGIEYNFLLASSFWSFRESDEYFLNFPKLFYTFSMNSLSQGTLR